MFAFHNRHNFYFRGSDHSLLPIDMFSTPTWSVNQVTNISIYTTTTTTTTTTTKPLSPKQVGVGYYTWFMKPLGPTTLIIIQIAVLWWISWTYRLHIKLYVPLIKKGCTQCRELPLCAGSGEGCQWQALPSPVPLMSTKNIFNYLYRMECPPWRKATGQPRR